MTHANHKTKTFNIKLRNTNTTLKEVIKSQEENKRKGRKNTYKNKSKTINKMAVRIYILIIM